jgi:hypothetical protein
MFFSIWSWKARSNATPAAASLLRGKTLIKKD